MSIPVSVSVIIPTFNYAHYITDCIRSVLDQNVDDVEVIVIDDGSTDKTEKVLEPFKQQIKYIYQENRGLSAARNTGIEHASGDFIQFLDSDDLLGVEALATRIQFLNDHPEHSIAVCENRLFTQLNARGLPKCRGAWALYRSNLELHLCRFNVAPPHAFLCRREVIDRTGEFDTSMKACEDYDYWLRAVSAGFVPQFCPGTVVYYRTHPTSMSANKGNQFRYDAEMHLRLFKILFEEGYCPTGAELNTSLAFLTGVVTTLMRLESLDICTEQQTQLRDIFSNVVKRVERHLGGVSKCDDLVRRVYSKWLAILCRQRFKFDDYFSEFPNLRNYLQERLQFSASIGDLIASSRGESREKLEASQLAKLTVASILPTRALARKLI